MIEQKQITAIGADRADKIARLERLRLYMVETRYFHCLGLDPIAMIDRRIARARCGTT